MELNIHGDTNSLMLSHAVAFDGKIIEWFTNMQIDVLHIDREAGCARYTVLVERKELHIIRVFSIGASVVLSADRRIDFI